jgi:predicted DCC family thiol-disulfide oxidoreductase YuxK
MNQMNNKNNSLILFDGVCNLCDGFVQFVISRDKPGKFMFGSLQSEAAQRILQEFNLPADELKTIVLIEDGKIFLRSKAVLKILEQLGGIYKIAKLFKLYPAFISDGVYNFISKHRYRFFGKKDSCMIPTPELQSRFIG